MKKPQRIFREFGIGICINRTLKGNYTVTCPFTTYRRFQTYDEALREVKILFIRQLQRQLEVEKRAA